MRYYADVNNDYLAKYLDAEILDGFTSSWFFYDKTEEFKLAEVLDMEGNVFSFLWEYADDTLSEKIDEWKRALKRNNIQLSFGMKIINKDYLASEKKVYVDIVETDFTTADELFKNFSAFNVAKNLTQFIVDKNMYADDLNLSFLDTADPLARFENCIKMIQYQWLDAIVLNGYHHRGDLVKVFIHSKEIHFLPEHNTLIKNIFENIYVANSLSWS
ncbi:hypothetical protein BBH99_13945 [Chryseobacterium contaminans]|uniref:Uncharacterized protein n=1 Tax=Chryseobacterium contaminans TaxID=1423959 RepID=A0A1M6XRT1_9FLAO|nr:hypothetical protein [Chryseobacterium contaminans]OCA71052.1 hypothetical protein BBH99_13945 [Chryseobacterium contaminans]SHL08603.1 hypothetical protein SAMN05444407_102189 [Chryseobacterium contaminans]